MGRPKANAYIDPYATDLASILARAFRHCSICHGLKPLTTDWFRFKPSTGRFDARCIWCQAQWERNAYHADRLRYLANKKRQREANPGCAARWRRANYERHRDRYCAQIVERNRSNPADRLRHNFRNRFNKVLGRDRDKSWRTLVGYTVHELKRHIEAQLPPEWTWDNYGPVWVIDHKRPVASFDLPRQVKECWALSNLRPLEKLENHRKGAKIIDGVSIQ